MATGAIGLIGGELPHIGFHVADMAVAAAQPGTVVAGITAAVVSEIQRCPGGGAVTVVAVAVGNEMAAVFAGGAAAVVASGAAAGDCAVVERSG